MPTASRGWKRGQRRRCRASKARSVTPSHHREHRVAQRKALAQLQLQSLCLSVPSVVKQTPARSLHNRRLDGDRSFRAGSRSGAVKAEKTPHPNSRCSDLGGRCSATKGADAAISGRAACPQAAVWPPMRRRVGTTRPTRRHGCGIASAGSASFELA